MSVSASQESAPLERNLWQLPRRHLTLTRPLIMGIVNVTPDSFSDGGLHATTEQAVAHALQLVEQGADILDIGGESTRPGATNVAADEELTRVVPVVTALAKQTDVPLSIDTSKAVVAEACLQNGAEIINDVTALTGDPAMLDVARHSRAGVILMHMQGTPQTMQDNPQYTDVVQDVLTYLGDRLTVVEQAGLDRARLVLDPGIGFGKSFDHNIQLLAQLSTFGQLGRPVCLGVSRKGFLGKITGRTAEHRINASLAVFCHALSQHAVDIVRVHDVAATWDVLQIWQALSQG